jgi:serine protease Do
MNKQFLSLFLVLVLSTCLSATAQTKEKIKKDPTVTIRKDGPKESITIVAEGDNVKVNGKSIEDMNDADIEALRKDGFTTSISPKTGKRIISGGNLKKLFDNDFSFRSNRAYLGVVTGRSEKGAKISSVEKESAAEKAGLREDDIITKVGDTKIEDSEDLYDAIGRYKPEDKVTVTYLRDGKQASVTATLGKSKSAGMKSLNLHGGDFNGNFNSDFNFKGLDKLRDLEKLRGLEKLREMPEMNGMNFGYLRKPRLGMEIQDVEEGKGVKVLDVDDDTPAAKAGLKKDDVISEVNGTTIDSVDDLKAKVRNLKEGDSIKVTYKRGGQTQTTDLKLPKKLKTAEL